MAPDDQFERVTLQRLRALERRTARLAWIVALGLAAFVWREVAYHPEVRSDRFTLVDDAGRERGMWRIRNGTPVLVLRDENGAWKSTLSIGEDGGGQLSLVGEPNVTQIDLAAGPERVSVALRSRSDDAGRVTLGSSLGNGRLEIVQAGQPPLVLPQEAPALSPR